MPQNSVGPHTARETDWKLAIEPLINFGKSLGPGPAAFLERLMGALHNFYMAFKGNIEDLRNTGAENLRVDPPSDSTAETSGDRSQGNSNSVHQAQSTPSNGDQRRQE